MYSTRSSKETLLFGNDRCVTQPMKQTLKFKFAFVKTANELCISSTESTHEV